MGLFPLWNSHRVAHSPSFLDNHDCVMFDLTTSFLLVPLRLD